MREISKNLCKKAKTCVRNGHERNRSHFGLRIPFLLKPIVLSSRSQSCCGYTGWGSFLLTMAKLSAELLRLYGLGELSAVDVQRIAVAAWQDGWGRDSRIAQRLVAMGSRGKHPGNMSRDLQIITVQYAITTAQARPYSMRLQDDKPLDVLLPHELYPALSKHGQLADWCTPDDSAKGALHRWANSADVALDEEALESTAALGVRPL